jgi:hypothetical protein
VGRSISQSGALTTLAVLIGREALGGKFDMRLKGEVLASVDCLCGNLATLASGRSSYDGLFTNKRFVLLSDAGNSNSTTLHYTTEIIKQIPLDNTYPTH